MSIISLSPLRRRYCTFIALSKCTFPKEFDDLIVILYVLFSIVRAHLPRLLDSDIQCIREGLSSFPIFHIALTNILLILIINMER